MAPNVIEWIFSHASIEQKQLFFSNTIVIFNSRQTRKAPLACQCFYINRPVGNTFICQINNLKCDISVIEMTFRCTQVNKVSKH